MKERVFNSALRSSLAVIEELALLEVPRLCHSLEASEEFRRSAFDPDVKYDEVYRVGLSRRDYNFLLRDFAFLQFWHHRGAGQFCLRYAYYPNPYSASSFEEFCGTFDVDPSHGEGYELYQQFLSEQELKDQVPVVRYEVSLRDYRELSHPAAHFHFGLHHENRWPVSRVLTPLAFTLLICKLFYFSAWEAYQRGGRRGSPHRNMFDDKLISAKAKSEVLGAAYFSPNEIRQLHFT